MIRKTYLALLLSAALIAPLASHAASSEGQSKISDDLRNLGPQERVRVIVQYHRPQAAGPGGLVDRLGGVVESTLGSITAVVATLTGSAIETLAENENVRYLSLDRDIVPELEYAGPAVGLPTAHRYGWDGKGIGIAVIDSGVAERSSLREQTVYHKSFEGIGPFDAYGHGTHVAGIIAGHWVKKRGLLGLVPTKDTALVGVAPEAHLVSLRVLDREGRGSDSGVVAAIEEAIALKRRYNIRVINLSVGRPVFESHELDPLCQAVKKAYEAGIVVVAAAGNFGRDNSGGTHGYATIASPGNSPYAITVGAMKDMATVSRADDRVATYSSKGPTPIDHFVKPDLVAPGNGMVSALAPFSTLVMSHPENIQPPGSVRGPSSEYFVLNGTSMAAPMVSGAAALLLQKNPSLTPDQVKAVLMRSASKDFPISDVVTDPGTGEVFTNYYDIFTVGAGYLDVAAALADTSTPQGHALSPVSIYDTETESAYMVMDEHAVWGSGAAWGGRQVWGSDRFVGGTAAVWGSRQVNGADVQTSDAIWGTAAVWGSRQVAGHDTVWGTAAVWGSRSGGTRAWSDNDVTSTTVLIGGE